MPLMKLREYARHRRCRLNAVQTALASGRITAVQGLIDSEQADADWEANTDPTRRFHVRRAPTDKQPSAPEASYAAAKLAILQVELARRRRELERLQAQFVTVAEFTNAAKRAVAAARRKLVVELPRRIQAALPGLTEQQIELIRALLDEALSELQELNDMQIPTGVRR